MKLPTALVVGSLALAWSGQGLAQGRDQISVVGSSTIYPFVTVAAERFGRDSEFRTPVVEQVGTGGGIKLFCEGLGFGTPDIATASRRMTRTEFERCIANEVDQLVEIKLGFDGILIAGALEGPPYDFSLANLYLGLAKDVPDPDSAQELVANPYQTWAEVAPGLENVGIHVYGPSPVHGTYDAFVDLAMAGGCRSIPWLAVLEDKEEARFGASCKGIREDGVFVAVSGPYSVVVDRLLGEPDSLGILGFNYLDRNRDLLKAATIDGVEPSLDNIFQGTYPLARTIYFYVKKAHIGWIPGLQAFLEEITSDAAAGKGGYLESRGLIPLPVEEHREMQEAAQALPVLTPEGLR